MSLRRVQLGYAVAVVVLVVVYYAWPFGRPVTTGAVGVVGMAAIAFGVVRLRPQRWGAWLFIGTAALLLGAGDVVFTILADETPGPVSYPGPPDVFYLAAYLPLAVGLLWLGRPPLPSRDWPMLLDTIGLSLAGSLLVWLFLVRPTVLDLNLSGAAKTTAIASWVGYIAVLATSARVVLVWRTNLSLGLLSAGVLTFLIADFLYGRQVISGTWSTGSLIDLGFLGFSLLSGAAALTSSMRQVASADYARHQLGPVRLTMLALALLLGPTVLLVSVTAAAATEVAIATVSAAVSVLMLVRLSLSARAYRRRADREQALRVTSRDLVQATTEDDVVRAVGDAFATMTSEPGSADVRLEPQAPGDESHALVPQSPSSPRGILRAGLPSTAAPGDSVPADGQAGLRLVFAAPLADLVELAPILYGLADQAGLALQRISLSDRLRDEERERYFRTLVLTSEDVTLISRAGRVEYASPSASTMFGRDVVGLRFDELLEAPTPAPAAAAAADGAAGEPFEATVTRPNGPPVIARVRHRDLTDDPTVHGVVATLRDVTAERQMQRDLAYRATHDPLTGLVNAQAFSNQVQPAEFANRRSSEAPGQAALFIDLDDFKSINDTFGHLAGDKLLTEVANRIRSCLRAQDLAARLGGDEFAVILRDLTGVEAAQAIAQRLTDTLAQPVRIDDDEMDCRASIGLAYTDRPEEADALIREADAALYTAKAQGKGQWRQYRQGMRTPTREHMANRRRLQEAIEGQRLVLHYQPIVAMQAGVPVGFEALLRFPGADPPMSPEDIVATAEETGLIASLGDWILHRAIADLTKLNPPGTPRLRYVSVNVSPRQLHQPDFGERVRAHLTGAGVDPALLVLEVTEHLPADTSSLGWQMLAGLRADGTRVAIDDYGTGCASLSYLRQSTIDIVKIDKSFLARESDPALLTAIINLCHQLNLQAIAEGVADRDAEELVLRSGCRYGQGFYYASSMPIDEAVRWTGRT